MISDRLEETKPPDRNGVKYRHYCTPKGATVLVVEWDDEEAEKIAQVLFHPESMGVARRLFVDANSRYVSVRVFEAVSELYRWSMMFQDG